MISLIAAVAANRAIGKNNELLWHLPADMAHFRAATRGKPVIMGRKTWESLPPRFRPLPGRQNIVISRDRQYDAPGATITAGLDEAVSACDRAEEAFIIGGADIYAQALPLADRLYLTEIDQEIDGDVFFPVIDKAQWEEISRSPAQSENGLSFSFVCYQRRR